MGITVSHRSALEVLRAARVSAGERGIAHNPTGLVEPQPDESIRWNVRTVREFKCNAGLPLGEPMHVLVADARRRIRAVGITCHVWNARMAGLCFMQLDSSGNAIPNPEVLLMQMAETLSLPQLVALGHELCGTYTLRPSADSGPAVTGIPAVTSVSKIVNLATSIRGLHGVAKLRKALPYLCDNSYSPMESCLSAMAQLPLEERGYQMGAVGLNVELEPTNDTSDYVSATFRKPDILFRGTSVGINYDGSVHLDLSDVKSAAMSLAKAPLNPVLQEGLIAALEEAQESVAADKQRDRDLMTMGYFVLPATKFDLDDISSLDRLMGQAMTLITRTCGIDLSLQKEALADSQLRAGRAQVLKALKAG